MSNSTHFTKKMTFRLFIYLAVGLFALAGLIFYTLQWNKSDVPGHQSGQHGGEVVPVEVAIAYKGNINITRRELGTVTPIASILVRSQINGLLTEVGFAEGQIVQKGDFLAQIDPRPYDVQLQKAQGALQRDQALLKEAELNQLRYQKLVKLDSVSLQTLDTQAALVQQYQGDIVADQSDIDAAKLNLIYCHITAPVTGRVGIRQIDAGNYVQTNDANGLVTLTQTQPISVLFSLPEDDISTVMKHIKDGDELSATAYDRTQTSALAKGKLVSMDSHIDTTTGTVKLRAAFDNSNDVLFPNQFVNIELLIDTLHDIVIVPTSAMQHGTLGAFVFLVKDNKTVTVKPVKTGPTQAEFISILDGLNVGDQVVISGTDRLHEGSAITIPVSNKSDSIISAPENPATSKAP